MADITYHFQIFKASELLNSTSISTSTEMFPLQLLYIELQTLNACRQQMWSPVSAWTMFVQLLTIFVLFIFFISSFTTESHFSWVFLAYIYDICLHFFSPLTDHILFTIIPIISITSELFSSSLSYALHRLTCLSVSTEPVRPREHSQTMQTNGFRGIILHKSWFVINDD